MAAPRKIAVFKGAHSRAVAIMPDRADLLVTFDHFNNAKPAWMRAKRSKTCNREGFALLRLQTLQNDWFINPDLAALEQAIGAFAGRYRRVYGLGYSLGGYAGLRLSQALGLQQMISISPQATLDPKTAPWEWRYDEAAKGFDPRLGDLAQAGGDHVRGVLLYDPSLREDRLHARAIERHFPRMQLAALPFSGHPASGLFSAGAGAGALLRLAMQDGTDRAAILSLFRRHREKSPTYWSNMARAMAKRHPEFADHAKRIHTRLVAQTGGSAT